MSYSLGGRYVNTLGEVVELTFETTKEKCQSIAKQFNKHHHKPCENRGYLNFDNGIYVEDKDGNRVVSAQWSKTCDCIDRLIEKTIKIQNLL